MLTCVASGADQLKEERLRYNATAEPEMADEQGGDCWDLSSEDDYSPTPKNCQKSITSEALVASAAGLRGHLEAELDGQETLSCHQRLPQHTALKDAVKQMLQQDGVVRVCRRQSLNGFAPCLHPTTAFCGMQGSLHSSHDMQQKLLTLFPLVPGTPEASAAQEYLQQVIPPAKIAEFVFAVWLLAVDDGKSEMLHIGDGNSARQVQITKPSMLPRFGELSPFPAPCSASTNT